MTWFLAKSEPQVYSIDRLRSDGKTLWDGVVNPQAVMAIKKMRAGDRVFFYHSGGESAIVGVAEVLTDGRADGERPWSQPLPCMRKMRLRPPDSFGYHPSVRAGAQPGPPVLGPTAHRRRPGARRR